MSAQGLLGSGLGSDEAEPQLWKDLKENGSASARERLFDLYLPLARQVARRRAFRAAADIAFDDLFQLACAGLLEALDQFDPGRGVLFKHYAARRIAGSVLDGVAKMNELRDQISHRRKAHADRVRSLRARDPAAESEARAIEELADLAVNLAIGFMLEDAGLVASETSTFRYATGYESLAWRQTAAALAAELSRLPEREQVVVRHHYLDGMGFSEIAALLSLSKGRVSQIHKSAITLLRKRLPSWARR